MIAERGPGNKILLYIRVYKKSLNQLNKDLRERASMLSDNSVYFLEQFLF